MGKTILQEWRKFMDDTYESDVHQNEVCRKLRKPHGSRWYPRIAIGRGLSKLIVGKYDTQDGASSLMGGSATADIVVSGIHASLDAKDRLVAHLKCPFGKNDGGIVIEPDDVQQLTKDSNKKTLAFKVTIKIEDKKTVFTDLFWPPKTYVRHFIPFRK